VSSEQKVSTTIRDCPSHRHRFSVIVSDLEY
jgi:hypothetical protein